MASANPAAIEAALAGAEAGLDKAEAEIERLEALDDSEDWGRWRRGALPNPHSPARGS